MVLMLFCLFVGNTPLRCGAAALSFRSKTGASLILKTSNLTLLMLFWFLIADGLGAGLRLHPGQMDRARGAAREEEVRENGEVGVKRRALRSPGGDRIMASRHYDRLSVPRFFLSFDFRGIDRKA
jgi:hypothetical protein